MSMSHNYLIVDDIVEYLYTLKEKGMPRYLAKPDNDPTAPPVWAIETDKSIVFKTKSGEKVYADVGFDSGDFIATTLDPANTEISAIKRKIFLETYTECKLETELDTY